MDDKRSNSRHSHGGSKVSQIANIFQSMGPVKSVDADILVAPSRFHASTGKGPPVGEQVSIERAFQRSGWIYLILLSSCTSHTNWGFAMQVPTSPKIDGKEGANKDAKDAKESPKEGSGVTVVRTESHLARFNNARALFEKLGKLF